MRHVIFDLDVMRSFVAGVDLGSFAKASARVGRSTSAVSAQLKRLEEQAGTPLFRKEGRGLALTEAGETLLSYARRLLDLNDEAASAVRNVDLDGLVKIGVQEDFGEILLPHVLGQFARAHPRTKIEARIARNGDLLDRVSTGALDLALVWSSAQESGSGEHVAQLPMKWIGRAEQVEHARARDEPIPLVLFEAPCLFRTTAIAALDRAGLAWRVALTSPSLAGLWAATSAGLGVTVRTELGLPPGMTPLDTNVPFSERLPLLSLVLHCANDGGSMAVDRLAEIVRLAASDAVSLSPRPRRAADMIATD